MKVLKSINQFRRVFMKKLTGNIGRQKQDFYPMLISNSRVVKILVCRPNARLGNLLMLTPLIQEIRQHFPGCTIDLFVKGSLAPVIFRNYPEVGNIIELPGKPFSHLFSYALKWLKIRKSHYDLAINATENSSSGKLAVLFSKANHKIFANETENLSAIFPDAVHMAKNPVYTFRRYFPIAHANKKIPSLNLRLNAFEKARGKDILNHLTGNSKKTICIFTYATGEKCYPKSWWMPFYQSLLNEFPDYHIVEILPAHDDSQIDYKAPSFFSKSIREIGAVMSNAELFIGADSGMMHLASAVNIPVIGLFSVTAAERYKPYNDYSISVNTNEKTMAELLQLIANTLQMKASDGLLKRLP